jgi:glycosyltransferase involved in cell wall biosynthesis
MLPWLPAFVEEALLPARMPLVLDYDDAVFHRYDLHRSRLVRAVLGAKLDRLMARADLVVAGNDYLAARARQAGAQRIEIVPTVVDLDRYPPQPQARPDGPVTIGWIGSPGTARYLDAVKPVLRDLAGAMPLRAIAIGARPDQLEGSVFEPVRWSEEGEVEALRSIDIGIMPLEDTPWERGKCGYKLIQYMALGIPVVASAIGVNGRIVRHGANGYLAGGATDWKHALAELGGNPTLRGAFGAAGRSDVEKEYALSVQAPRLAGMIRSVVAAHAVATGRR